MRGSMQELPAMVEMPGMAIRQTVWGDTSVEFGRFADESDPAPLYKGLPDDRCQCPHWGYVIAGQVRFRYADHEEIFNAGDAYYAQPSHLPLIMAGTEYVEFSPVLPYGETIAVVGANMAALGV